MFPTLVVLAMSLTLHTRGVQHVLFPGQYRFGERACIQHIQRYTIHFVHPSRDASAAQNTDVQLIQYAEWNFQRELQWL